MRPTTLAHLDRLDADLAALATDLAAYDQQILNQPPPGGGWSAMQCLHHLRLSEKGTLLYIQKKLSFDPQLPQRGLLDPLRRVLLLTYLYLPIKFRAPRGLDTSALPTDSELAPTLEKWRHQRQQLRTYLAALDDQRFDQLVFKHPFAGRLGLDTTLYFFRGHFQRHRRQALRALAALG